MQQQFVLRVLETGELLRLRLTPHVDLSPSALLAFENGVHEANAAVEILRQDPSGLLMVRLGACIYTGIVQRDNGSLKVTLPGIPVWTQRSCTFKTAAIDTMEQETQALSVHTHREIRSPIPGAIRKVLVEKGDQVEPGQTLLVLEAMKMENEIAAPSAGTILTICVSPGQTVEAGTLLLEFER